MHQVLLGWPLYPLSHRFFNIMLIFLLLLDFRNTVLEYSKNNKYYVTRIFKFPFLLERSVIDIKKKQVNLTSIKLTLL